MTLHLFGIDFDHVVYDDRGDVLYLSVGEPRSPARAEATDEGHQVRYDESGRIIGLTIVNARWLVENNGRIVLDVPAADLEPALT